MLVTILDYDVRDNLTIQGSDLNLKQFPNSQNSHLQDYPVTEEVRSAFTTIKVILVMSSRYNIVYVADVRSCNYFGTDSSY